MPVLNELERGETSAQRATPGRGRLVGLALLGLTLLLIPTALSTSPVQRVMGAMALTDRHPGLLEISLVNPGGANTFVEGGKALQIRYEIGSTFHTVRRVHWQISVEPDIGGSKVIRNGNMYLAPGQSRFQTFSGRVACSGRSRLVFRAQTPGERTVSVYSHITAYRSHGTLICTSDLLVAGG